MSFTHSIRQWRAVAEQLRASECANTLRSYTGALRYWAAWYWLRYRVSLSLPVPVSAVRQFLVDHCERAAPDGNLVHDLPDALDRALVDGGLKAAPGAPALSTVLHRLAVLSSVHKVRALPNPARDPAVQELIRRVASTAAS